MLDLASATRIHNRSEMSHQPLDGHDLLPTLRRKDHLPPDNLPAIGFSCVAPAIDPSTGEILASELTSNEEGDASQVGPLLDQIPGPLASVIADGAYGPELTKRSSDTHKRTVSFPRIGGHLC